MAVVCMTDMSGIIILKARMSLLARLSTFDSVQPDRRSGGLLFVAFWLLNL